MRTRKFEIEKKVEELKRARGKCKNNKIDQKVAKRKTKGRKRGGESESDSEDVPLAKRKKRKPTILKRPNESDSDEDYITSKKKRKKGTRGKRNKPRNVLTPGGKRNDPVDSNSDIEYIEEVKISEDEFDEKEEKRLAELCEKKRCFVKMFNFKVDYDSNSDSAEEKGEKRVKGAIEEGKIVYSSRIFSSPVQLYKEERL